MVKTIRPLQAPCCEDDREGTHARSSDVASFNDHNRHQRSRAMKGFFPACLGLQRQSRIRCRRLMLQSLSHVSCLLDC